MNINNDVILIDTSYIFHRVTATEVWCKKSGNEFNDENIYKNFLSSISKLSKKYNFKINEMILCRDVCDVWRKYIYDKYKEKRTYSMYGPYIKELYKRIEKEKIFDITLRIKEAEADDIIGVLVYYYKDLANNIYIVSNDKDFEQLTKFEAVKLVDNSKFEIKNIKNYDLEKKIIDGDRSDGIKKLSKDYTISEYLLNKQLIDLSYTPRYIQDAIFSTLYFPITSNTKPLRIQLGYACINTILRKENIFCSRTLRVKTVQEKGVEYLKSLIVENVKDLKKMVEWNARNGIRLMRMSSEMMPHITNPLIKEFDFDFVKKDLSEIGEIARYNKQRLTFHPGQFNVLSTPNEKVFLQTKRELKWHADVLDAMGMDADSIMVIHGGGLYGNKEEATQRFIDNFNRLDDNVKDRLVIENCEKCYNVKDVLYISKIINIPVIFDTHHYTCYNKLKDCEDILKESEYMPDILKSWTRRGIKPKFHISEQRENSRIGSHSDYVEVIPNYLLEIPEKYNIDIDIMIEAKEKEQAVFHLYELYPEISPFTPYVKD